MFHRRRSSSCSSGSLVAVGVGAWLARRRHDDGPDRAGRASLIAMSVTFIAIVAITLVIESTLSAAQQATASAEERSRSVLLDRFDTVRRPWAVRYSPFEVVAPREALPWIMLGTRTPPSPFAASACPSR